VPLYSYHCSKCDKDFELLVRSSDTPACPTCGNIEIAQQVSFVAPENKSRTFLRGARAQAAREGHLSNFSRSERGGS
jgi:putative FmdB family regulatory protein